MVLVGSDDLPASVVIRDSSGAVVFQRHAHPRPDKADDLMELETPTLLLDEGDYAVECRPGEGAATAVPLRVTWAVPASVEQDKSVVVRVFETPDQWK